MKIDGMPGKYAFKALYSLHPSPSEPSAAWNISSSYYFSKEEAEVFLGKGILWPVEIDEHGVVYIPHPSEYEVKSGEK